MRSTAQDKNPWLYLKRRDLSDASGKSLFSCIGNPKDFRSAYAGSDETVLDYRKKDKSLCAKNGGKNEYLDFGTFICRWSCSFD